jgi:hypothetical protein
MKRCLLAAALVAAFSFPAPGQEVPVFRQAWRVSCTRDIPAFRAALETKYGETRMLSTSADGVALDIWTNPETGTWTIVLYYPNGTACVPLSGEGEWIRHVQGVPS